MLKKSCIYVLLGSIYSLCVIAEQDMSLEQQLEEANRLIEEETQKQQELSDELKNLEAKIEELRMRAKELDEQIGE